MKKPVDPFGISLLDLLSNALGATILLLLILSIKSRGSSQTKNESATGAGNGKWVTLFTGKEEPHIDTMVITVEIKLISYHESLKINNPEWHIYRKDPLSENDYWAIKNEGSFNKQMDVEINNFNQEGMAGKEFIITVFKANACIYNKRLAIKDKKIFWMSRTNNELRINGSVLARN